MKKLLSVSLLCGIASVATGYLHANRDNFITIIGPDGFPIIVPNHEKNVVEKDQKKDSKPVPATPAVSFSQSEPPVKNEIKPNVAQSEASLPQKIEATQKPGIEATQKPGVVQTDKKLSIRQDQANVTPPEKINIAPLNVEKEKLQKEEKQPPVYTELQGEKYYEAEYLESKEFNLEEKKRFYQIPMFSGGSNWNVIERTKGVDMSWFNLRNQQQETDETIALGQHYTVVPKSYLEQALPQSCIIQKELDKAKTFGKDTVSVWPRAPFSDDFDFDLVSLKEKQLKSFRLSSYAKSDKDRTFYWPLVVFLDAKGCVMEGAIGYFTKSYPSTALQTEVLEGNLQLPQGSQFILFTALAEAVDLPDRHLTNHGQIKLTRLR